MNVMSFSARNTPSMNKARTTCATNTSRRFHWGIQGVAARLFLNRP